MLEVFYPVKNNAANDAANCSANQAHPRRNTFVMGIRQNQKPIAAAEINVSKGGSSNAHKNSRHLKFSPGGNIR